MAAKRPGSRSRSRAGSRSKGPSSREGQAERPAGALVLDEALAGIAPPEDELEAGFFHRTLARWLGLPEGRGGAEAPVLWSYDFWKAEIVELGAAQGRVRYAAHVYRGASARAERYEYWLELDGTRRIRRSGWLSQAPDLMREGDAFLPPPPPDAAELAALFHDAPADD
ncbi:MAG: hypothetical protein IT382_21000 [Deltaproteobacteria bacterium]|nr:hypothetical protein [Deltaproteobacteria bacterium]